MLLFSTHLLLLLLPAWILDRILGEPVRFHPLVGFGRCVEGLEEKIRRGDSPHALLDRLKGMVAVLILLSPPVLLAFWLGGEGVAGGVVQTVLLYLTLGGKSLGEHGRRVAMALETNDLALARTRVGYMVSRDTEAMDPPMVARATVESVLENGCDALFGAMFWFLLLGAPGAVLFRLANTLDAMWGYRNQRYGSFGWFAARLDDVLGYLPARLTAVTYLLLGQSRLALAAWRRCVVRKSPNATLVMAVGGGTLNLRLGGGGVYHGQWKDSPILGGAIPPCGADISRAISLVERGEILWVGLATLAGGLLILLKLFF